MNPSMTGFLGTSLFLGAFWSVASEKDDRNAKKFALGANSG